jgi:hypothetical protein
MKTMIALRKMRKMDAEYSAIVGSKTDFNSQIVFGDYDRDERVLGTKDASHKDVNTVSTGLA